MSLVSIKSELYYFAQKLLEYKNNQMPCFHMSHWFYWFNRIGILYVHQSTGFYKELDHVLKQFYIYTAVLWLTGFWKAGEKVHKQCKKVNFKIRIGTVYSVVHVKY